MTRGNKYVITTKSKFSIVPEVQFINGITAILAISKNNVIGDKGKLPWKCKRDIEFFRSVIDGKTCIVGRKTYETLPKLPVKKYIILTKNNFHDVIQNLEKEAYVIGGAQIYKLFIPYCDKVFLSIINEICKGDTFFDTSTFINWKKLKTIELEKDRAVCHILQNPLKWNLKSV